jgi:hypothetical protein
MYKPKLANFHKKKEPNTSWDFTNHGPRFSHRHAIPYAIIKEKNLQASTYVLT